MDLEETEPGNKKEEKGNTGNKVKKQGSESKMGKTKRWRNLKVKSNLERASQSKKETLKVMCQKRARSAGKLKMKRPATKRINECFISYIYL